MNERPIEIFFEICDHCDQHQWCTHHHQNKYLNHFNKSNDFPYFYIINKRVVKNDLLAFDPNILIHKNNPPKSYLKIQGINPLFLDRIDNKMKTFPRIGSFEVKIAEKLFFSKLESGIWPTSVKIINLLKSSKETKEEIEQIKGGDRKINLYGNCLKDIGCGTKKLTLRSMSPQNLRSEKTKKTNSKSPPEKTLVQIQEKILKKFGKKMPVIKEITNADDETKEEMTLNFWKTPKSEEKIRLRKASPLLTPKKNILYQDKLKSEIKIIKVPKKVKSQIKCSDKSFTELSTIRIISLAYIEEENVIFLME